MSQVLCPSMSKHVEKIFLSFWLMGYERRLFFQVLLQEPKQASFQQIALMTLTDAIAVFLGDFFLSLWGCKYF